MDRRESYRIKALANSDKIIGPWLSTTILKDSAKRARNNGWLFDIDRDYLTQVWYSQQGRCAVSGVAMQTESGTRENKNPYRASLDRIDNSQGYVIGNVRFVCHWVNNAKSTWDQTVFDEFVSNIMESRS